MWLGIVKVLLSLVGSFMSYLNDKQLLDAGKALAENAGLKKAATLAAKADAAVASVMRDIADGRLRKLDKFQRPD